ncbi:MAG: molybdopterin-dependent oxidoreductase [Proteobacteria bacterium]|nr:molybdopterin-dependent oxidoreductase [Pseudomonadota bacterium]
MEVIKTDCALCVNCCGIDVYVDNGRLVKVEGTKEHPVNLGHLCPKGERLVEYVYSKDRLQYPMRRQDGKWHRISWDEALDEIASKLKEIKERYGAHALAVYTGSVGVEHLEISFFAQRFRGAFGTPNFITVDSGCWRARILARILTFGTFPSEDLEKTKCVVLWGHNPDESRFPVARQIRKAVGEGAKLIVIDPRRIPLAKEGIHLQLRPGTDCALALGMMHVIISEGLYDKAFVEEWTFGFDKLAEHVKAYAPKKVEEMTWVPAADIERSARLFATTRPGVIVQGVCSLERQINNMQNNRVLAILQSITGNIDVPGGWVTTQTIRFTDLRLPVDEAPMGAEEYPLFYNAWGMTTPYGHAMLFPDRVLSGKPYPIKALIVGGGNPAVTIPDSEKYRKALEKLDLVVVMDLVMSETAKMADIVLPASSFFEQSGIGDFPPVAMHGLPYVMLRKKVIEPLGESWPDWKIWSEMGRRMGYEATFPWKTDEEMIEMLLEPSGITLKQLQDKPAGFFYTEKQYGRYKEKGFRTPTGKVEIFSETFKDAGFDPLPVPIEPSQSGVRDPELAKEYPLILITGAREVAYIHGQLRHLPELRRIAPEAEMEIHPVTAGKYGVLDGEKVIVETKKGKIKIKAKLTEDIAEQVVSIPHGWATANVNLLTDIELRDPISGYPEDKGLQCKIARIE